MEIEYNERKYALETNYFIEKNKEKLKYFSKNRPITITNRKDSLTEEKFKDYIFNYP